MRTERGIERPGGETFFANLEELLRELTANVRGLNDELHSGANERAHSTAEQTNRLGQFPNGVLWQGGVQLDSTGFKRITQRTPFASVTIADPNNEGPFVISNGALSSSEIDTATLIGPGYWRVPAGAHETIPMSGREFDIGGPAGAVIFLVLYVDSKPYSFSPEAAASLGITSPGPVDVTAVDTSTTIAAANAQRTGLLVWNTDAASNLYLTYGPTSSTSLFTVKLVPGAYWEMPAPMYPGVVSGIWDGAPTGAAMVTQTVD